MRGGLNDMLPVIEEVQERIHSNIAESLSESNSSGSNIFNTSKSSNVSEDSKTKNATSKQIITGVFKN